MGAALEKHEHNPESLSVRSHAGTRLSDEATSLFKPKSKSERSTAGGSSEELIFDRMDIYGVGIRGKSGHHGERTNGADKHASTPEALSVNDSDKVKLSARAVMTDGDYKSFAQDMQSLGRRADKIATTYEKQGMPAEQAKQKAQEQLNETYKQVGSLLGAKDNPSVPIDAAGRSRLAREIIKNAADPTEIRQGYHNTCNVATIENRLYTRQPALAAKLVVDMATTGSYVAKDGTKVALDRQSLTPDQDAEQKNSLSNRNFASQIFQVTAVNLAYAKAQPSIHYEQHRVDPKLPGDTGERQVDYSSGKPQERIPGWFERQFEGATAEKFHRPVLVASQLLKIQDTITGTKEDNWVLQNYGRIADGVISPASPVDLANKVVSAKESGKLPLTVLVHTGNEPFLGDSGGGTAGGAGSWHVVNIADVEPGKDAKLAIDNEWSKQADHLGADKLSVRDVYRAMREPGDAASIKDLADEVSDNRKAGKVDDFKELELLRLQKLTGKISPEQYNQAILDQIKESQTRWNQALKAGLSDRDTINMISKASGRQSEAIFQLPPHQMIEALKIQQDAGYASQSSVEKMLGYSIKLIRSSFQKETADPSQPMSAQKSSSYREATHRMVEMIDAMPPERRASVRKTAQDYTVNSQAAR